jgi:hypothetical protein
VENDYTKIEQQANLLQKTANEILSIPKSSWPFIILD